jgi:hypothetical protein
MPSDMAAGSRAREKNLIVFMRDSIEAERLRMGPSY